jgi:plasmid stabilization system protein ParE
VRAELTRIVKYAPAAIRDLQRLREFLRVKNPIAAKKAGDAIVKAIKVLSIQPQMGRIIQDMPEEYREWLIDFGDSGYVARYRLDADGVVVLAIRHQKEAGY